MNRERNEKTFQILRDAFPDAGIDWLRSLNGEILNVCDQYTQHLRERDMHKAFMAGYDKGANDKLMFPNIGFKKWYDKEYNQTPKP